MTKNLALPWYDRQDWKSLHRLFVERDCIPENYDVWKQRALRAERRYRKKGYGVVRIAITPNDLQAWCLRAGREIDLNARHEFAVEKLGSFFAAARSGNGTAASSGGEQAPPR